MSKTISSEPAILLSTKSTVRPTVAPTLPSTHPTGGDEESGNLESLSLRGNFIWAFGGNLVFAACQWGVLAVIAKTGNPADVGQFALALAITAPLFLFANLQLRSVQATDVNSSHAFGHYFALRLLTTALALAVLPIILWGLGYRFELALLVMVVGCGKGFDSLSDVAYGLVQKHQRLDRSGRARVLAGVSSLAGLFVAFTLTGSLVWAAVGWASGHGVTALLAKYWVGRDLLRSEQRAFQTNNPAEASLSAVRPRWELATLRRLALIALPLGFVMMLVSVNLNAPRYFIEHYLSAEQLGVYAAMAYLMIAGHMVVLAMGQASVAKLARQFDDADFAAFFGLLLRLLGLAALGAVCAVITAATIGPWVLAILYTPEYAKQGSVLVCLAAVAGVEFASSFLGEAMTAARSFRAQVPLMLVVVTATCASCFWLIPRHGLMGGALASGVGAVVHFVGAAGIVLWAVRQRQSLR